MEENMGDTWFYAKLNQTREENSVLREEIAKLDDKNVLLERINACLKRQLEEDHKKYDEMRQEYDKLQLALYEIMEKERLYKCAHKKYITEKQILTTKLESAELKAQEIESLKEKLKKAMKERSDSTRKVVEMTKTLEEEHTKCEYLQTIVKELEEANVHLQKICESRENTIQELRETSRELADENAELKLLIDKNVRLSIDLNFASPNSDTESFYMHGTSICESNGAVHQDSLYDELKASGFMNTYDRDDTINQLEDQVNWYELEINTLLKQTERVFEQLISLYGEERFRLCVTKNLDDDECSEKTRNFETLKQRVQILLDLITTTTSKIVDINTKLQADSETTRNIYEVCNFHEHFKHALDAGNGSISPLTVNQNSHGETVPVQPDILQEAENFPLQMSPTIVRGSSQRPTMETKDLKRTSKAMSERDLLIWHNNDEFTDANVESHGAMIQSNRRSKSESSLIAKKKPTPLHNSFNVFTMSLPPENKTSKGVETRGKFIIDSTPKKRELKNIEETKEQNGAQNLMSWQEYKFGGTYRSLNDSTDSSICSTPSRRDSLFGSGDYSLSEPRQLQHEFRSVRLAPTKFKRLSIKIPSFLEENGVNDADTGCQRIDGDLSSSYKSNMFKRSSHVFTEHDNPKECGISDEMQFLVTTVKGTKDCIDATEESIYETSADHEKNANGFEKSVHENLPNIEELHDILEKIENSLEENNNVLRGNDFYTTTSVKSTDSSELAIVRSERSQCATVVSHFPTKRILFIPSWRTFISCALVFIMGYYLRDVVPLRSTSTGAPCTWYSLEEMFNRYFPIRSRKLPPI